MKTPEQLENMVKCMKGEMTAGPVCDSTFECDEWKMAEDILENFQQINKSFKFCPFCGNKVFSP